MSISFLQLCFCSIEPVGAPFSAPLTCLISTDTLHICTNVRYCTLMPGQEAVCTRRCEMSVAVQSSKRLQLYSNTGSEYHMFSGRFVCEPEFLPFVAGMTYIHHNLMPVQRSWRSTSSTACLYLENTTCGVGRGNGS